MNNFSNLKKRTFRRAAVLFSVIAVMLTTVSPIFADTASIFSLTPTFTRQYSDGTLTPTYSTSAWVKWDLRELGLDNGDTYTVEFDVVGSGSQWGTHGVSASAFKTDRLTNAGAGTGFNTLQNIKTNGHYSGSYAISSDYVGFGFSTDAYGDCTITISNLTITSDSIVITVPTQGYTRLEYGNIVYFDIGANTSYDISMTSEFFSYSGIISGIWPDDNRRYGFSSDLPVANTTFLESAGTSIPWVKNTTKTLPTGQSKVGDANITGTSIARYLWVINPTYNNKYFEDSLDANSLNGLMKIYGVPANTPVYTYKLKQNATSIGLDSDIPSTSGGVGTISENEGQATTWNSTDDTTQPYTQTAGGDTTPPDTVSAADGIKQTLDQFVAMFNDLFTKPVEYIQHLIQSGQGFIQVLSGLFKWMPEAVVDVFTSALILMIVIGVLKMLL